MGDYHRLTVAFPKKNNFHLFSKQLAPHENNLVEVQGCEIISTVHYSILIFDVFLKFSP